LDADCGGSFLVESADSSEKRISASSWIEPSVPMASAAGCEPRLIASTPSWIAEAPEAQAVVSVIGEPCVRYFRASTAARWPKVKSRCAGVMSSFVWKVASSIVYGLVGPAANV
jgi:hypothetical protein